MLVQNEAEKKFGKDFVVHYNYNIGGQLTICAPSTGSNRNMTATNTKIASHAYMTTTLLNLQALRPRVITLNKYMVSSLRYVAVHSITGSITSLLVCSFGELQEKLEND